MPTIIVTTVISTAFEVPEGLTIEQIRHAGMPDLCEMEETTDEVVSRHDQAINRVFIGAAVSRSCSSEHAITEVAEPINPA